MTSTFLQIDPGVLGLALIVWTWVGMRAGSLARADTPRELYARTGRLLAGVALGVAAILARIGVVIGLADGGWRLLRGTGMLTGLVALGVALPIGALVVSAPTPPAHADAGHGVLDLGGGRATDHRRSDLMSISDLRGHPR